MLGHHHAVWSVLLGHDCGDSVRLPVRREGAWLVVRVKPLVIAQVMGRLGHFREPTIAIAGVGREEFVAV